MQPNPYAVYPYPNGTGNPQTQVRYMVPQGAYRQTSPPFANQAFDRYGTMPGAVRPNSNMMQPIRHPQGARPGYPPPGMPMQPASTMVPIGTSPRPSVNQQQGRPGEQLQPPQPYYYNPNGLTPRPPVPQPPKKGTKEYKENAFTIAPDGAHSEAIKGLVSNNDINDLLKHKGTRVKVSKIYRITKTKPEVIADSSSDEELPPPIQKTPLQPASVPAPAPASAQRPDSSSSSSSRSTCSSCSCDECRGRERSHIYDDCPECRSRERSHVYDDCPECRAEWEREQARRQRRK